MALLGLTPDGELSSEPVGSAEVRLDLGLVAGEVARIRPRGGRTTATVSDRRAVTEIQPLGLHARPELYLAVTVEDRMSAGQRSTVTTAVALLSLAIESSRQRRETERALRARSVELAVVDDPRSARIVLATVPGQPRLPARCRVLRATGAPDALTDGLLLVESTGALAARLGSELVVVTSDRRATEIATPLAGAGLLVGVGDLVTATQISHSHEHAGHALAQTTAAAPLLRWDHLVGQGALAMLDRPRATAFAASYLEPLDTPQTGRHDLVRTLQCFVRHHGSRAKVAEELGVHRNTVRARVEQIERLLGASLDDPATRATAWIALQLRNG